MKILVTADKNLSHNREPENKKSYEYNNNTNIGNASNDAGITHSYTTIMILQKKKYIINYHTTYQ